MIRPNSIVIAVIGTVFVACVAKKKSLKTTAVQEPVILLDTLVVKPKDEFKQKIYAASVNRLSDILHTKLEVEFNWKESTLHGKATIDVKPYFYPTKKLVLDARGMQIEKVQIEKAKSFSDLNYVYERDSIKIELDKEYSRNEKYSIYIEYTAKPNELKEGGSNAIKSDKGLYFINPMGSEKNKMPQIWTQGETQSNSVWFPTIDAPNERMTEEIYMTVEDKYVTLSNGLLVEQIKNANGTRTDHWKMDLPHAPYLVMMAIGEYKIVKDKWKDKEVNYYVEKEYEPYAKAIFGNTPEMMEFFSNKLGVQFPWPKYAQVVARDYVSGAMENTSATLHGDFVYQTDRELLDGSKGEDVISHELFHQWFGDLVTCESWSNLPLNESFATYGEYLWEEYKYGLDAADAVSLDSKLGYFSESKRKQVELIRYELKDREDMFDAHSYNKGGQILHMLRKYVGDDAFFAALKLYLEKNKYTAVEIHNLRLAFEEVTGEDLNWFFNQWFLSKGHPELDVQYTYDEVKKSVKLTVQQKQDLTNSPLYKLPLYVDVYTENNQSTNVQRQHIVIKEKQQDFFFSVENKPLLVNFDAEKQLLCTENFNKTTEQFIYQYKHAPKFLDRYEALVSFKGLLNKQEVYETVKLALQDKSPDLREYAINLLQEVAAAKETEIKPVLMGIAEKDVKSTLRAEAISFLAKKYKDKTMLPLFENAIKDKSYAVMSAGLRAVVAMDTTSGYAKAKELETEKSKKLAYAIMEIYSNYGNDSNNDYFIQQRNQLSGFELLGFVNLYSLFLKRCSEETTISGTAVLKEIALKAKNKYIKFTTQNAVKTQLTRYQGMEDKFMAEIEEKKKNNADVSATEKRLNIVKATKKALKEMYDAIL